MTTPPRSPRPWLFALSGMPYGVVGSFAGTVMPYLTRRAGIEVDSIGWYGSLLLVPSFFQFLYAPIVDIGPKRKHWLVIVAALAGAALMGACLMPLPSSITPFLALAFVAAVLTSLVGACNGGLLAVTMPDAKRGAAGGFYNIGNLSGGAVSAAIAVYMTTQNYEPISIGLVLAAMMIVPSLAILTIDEPERDNIQRFGEMFTATLRDVKSIVTSRHGLSGLLLSASPVGTAALINYFSAFGPDYKASDETMVFISGPANAVLTAVGALAGGWLCDRYNRRSMYLLSGSLLALCGLVMMLSPRTDTTFIYGACVYFVLTGFCYSSFTATVLETIGKGGKAASTQYSLFTAAGNFAITYVGFIDTRFHKQYGVEGVVASDAVLNFAGVVVLGLVFWKIGSFKKKPAPAQP